jgi:hypothetical protein
MKPKSNRPKLLWSQEGPPDSVNEYFDAYMGEFGTDWIESGYPYKGPAEAVFLELSESDLKDGFDRFQGQGIGCWVLRNNDTLNDLTADLLAAAELLGGELWTDGSSAAPGGTGVDAGAVWLKLLDGGVGAEVVLCEADRTNEVEASQVTTVRGARAFRCVVELLGFDPSIEVLPGETKAASREDITQLVDELLNRRRAVSEDGDDKT